ncbi:hypothetical protein F511_19258 [Dorcoceras hygrometricum]|uniref:Uncharacterized protein n=1 Tax=Dorcoceras hygrometricum TaxID=472368 RepID=A0A2Z7CPL4_9LAMI|nr:hypothetical protein F511_19258 [Dorcoceras hygrometricum]
MGRRPAAARGNRRRRREALIEGMAEHLGIQLAVGQQPLRLRNHNFGLAHRIMVKRLATSPHDPLGITDSACNNHLVVVSVQYGPFNIYIPIRSTTIGKSRVARDPIAMHTSWRSNSDIASVTRKTKSDSVLGAVTSERLPTLPVLLIKPETSLDSTSITDYLASNSDATIHQKKTFLEHTT